MKNILFLVLIGITISACETKDCCIGDQDDSFDRGALLTNVVDHHITPTYQNFADDITTLKQTSELFLSQPDLTTLNDLKERYNETYISWQKMALHEGGSGSRWGPSADLYLKRYVNTYPTKPLKIEEAIDNDDYNLETNFIIQGLPALDYLLYGFDENTTIDQFTDLSKSEVRGKFLLAVIDQMDIKTNDLINRWATYKTSFTSNDGTASNSSFAKLLNGFTEYYEQQIRKAKLGGPFGKFTQGVKRPQDIETLYSKQSIKMLSIAHQAMIDFYNGKGVNGSASQPSIRDYIHSTMKKAMGNQKDLDVEFDNRLKEVQQKIDLVEGDYNDLVTAEAPSLEEVYTSFQSTIALLKVEVFAALNSSISYADTDGD